MKASTEPRTRQSVFLCRVVTPDQTTPPANVWVQMQGTGRGTYAQEGKGQEQGGRKAWPTWSSQDISLLLTFGCLPRATGREVKLLLLRSHSPWWQQFDGPLWNSYPLVTSDTWHRCIYIYVNTPDIDVFTFETQSHLTTHHHFHLWHAPSTRNLPPLSLL